MDEERTDVFPADVDCDDDGGTGLQSMISYSVVSGDDYLVVVDGYSSRQCGRG